MYNEVKIKFENKGDCTSNLIENYFSKTKSDQP